MRKFVPAFALAALSLATGSQLVLAHEDHVVTHDPLVEARKGGMTMMVPTLTAVGRAAEGEGSVARAAFPASGLASFARSLPALFGPDTDGTTGSAALPAIWEDEAGFAAQVAEFQSATAALEAAARADDRESFTAALDRTKASCQSCHEAYRAE
ncbi:cytochrome c [Parerythrobacter lacustris]|uniref:Cytochrome c n=1 Tax=Parerythrobacter lacustris TaxID=2969984 RepID=A0ABT1XN82_9SPHN|nr:cytochrome c [Parerythrobacter lacustris]MCR2833105.1 cytochrome c [Parerythrobacter lacustris]